MDAQSVDALLSQCLSLFNARKYAEATDGLKQVVAAQPGNVKACTLLGACLGQTGHHSEAVEQFLELTRLDHGNPLHYFNLGNAYRSCGKIAQAEGAYRKAIEINPGYQKASEALKSLSLIKDFPGQVTAPPSPPLSRSTPSEQSSTASHQDQVPPPVPQPSAQPHSPQMVPATVSSTDSPPSAKGGLLQGLGLGLGIPAGCAVGCLVVLLGLIVIGTIGGLSPGSGPTSGSTSPTTNTAGSQPSVPSTTPSSRPAAGPADLELVSMDYSGDRITGIVRNNTGRDYSYVQVEFNIYDSTGAQIGSTMDNINNLEPHGTWRFSAYVFESNGTKCRLKDITGW